MTGWAFVGTSGWVDSRFAPSVVAAGEKVVGAFGSSAAGSAKFAAKHGGRPYGSLAELLADPAVDAVWVASPTALHPAHASAAAAAGHAVLVEKPLAADLAAARDLARDLAGHRAVTGMGFHHRFNPAIHAVRRALPQVGTLTSLVVHHAFAGPASPAGWRQDPSASGGWSIGDIGTHLLDIAQFLLGDLEFAAARRTSPGRGLAVDDLACVLLAAGEATVFVRAGTGTAGPPAYVEATGTDGWVRATGFWTGGGRITDSAGRDSEVTPADPYVEQVRAFSAAVAGAPWTGATIADGLLVTEWALS